MDYFANGKAHGQVGNSVATRLLASNGDYNCLRTHGTLRKDEWVHMDNAVIEVSRQRLIATTQLMRRGLVYNLPNAMGVMSLEHETVSDMNPASVNMELQVMGDKDNVEYGIGFLPIPIIHKEWDIGLRRLTASRQKGTPLDTTMATTSARKVAEQIEGSLFTGYTFNFAGGQVYGLTTYPDRITAAATEAWDGATKTGALILTDILAWKQALIDAKFFGPYGIYIPTAYECVLEEDFKAESDKTIRQRLLEVKNIEFIEVADFQTADNISMFQLSSDVIRIVNGMGVTNVQWEEKGGSVFEFRTMAIMVPQIRSEFDGNCGVLHWVAT